MKTLLITLALVTTQASLAKDSCLKKLTVHFQEQSQLEGEWEFMNLFAVSKSDLPEIIENAVADDEGDSKTTMSQLAKNKNVLFYGMEWSAPSNTGANLVAVSKKSCKIIKTLLVESEE